MPYTPENVDIPSLVVLRPVFASDGTIYSVPAHANYLRRIKNDADATDILTKDGATVRGGNTAGWDQWATDKNVTVAGIGTFTYRHVARLMAKIADLEHDAVS